MFEKSYAYNIFQKFIHTSCMHKLCMWTSVKVVLKTMRITCYEKIMCIKYENICV
jgi:hypothetical protein